MTLAHQDPDQKQGFVVRIVQCEGEAISCEAADNLINTARSNLKTQKGSKMEFIANLRRKTTLIAIIATPPLCLAAYFIAKSVTAWVMAILG